MIRLVLFDLDDTLYPERDFVLSGFRAVAARAASDLGLPSRQVLRALLASFRHDRRSVFDRVAGALAPDRPALVADWVRTYREHEPRLQPPWRASER